MSRAALALFVQPEPGLVSHGNGTEVIWEFFRLHSMP